MNQSFTSHFSATLSIKSDADPAPMQLFGYLYDIPKETKAADLKQVFSEQHIDCNVQIKREPKKPFDTAMVKFQSSVHLQIASEKLRYFTTPLGHKIRFLPFEANLHSNKSELDDKENCEDNLPDNSNLKCNLCVTGLDESLTSEDLHSMFSKFGELKSCKVSRDPATLKSKCYGYVWFYNESDCVSALKAGNEIPYQV